MAILMGIGVFSIMVMAIVRATCVPWGSITAQGWFGLKWGSIIGIPMVLIGLTFQDNVEMKAFFVLVGFFVWIIGAIYAGITQK